MTIIKVYHNPNFLDYRGRHTHIVPPTRPVATVEVSEELSAEQAMEVAFHKTQHIDDSWWNNPDVRLHIRSTSVGDVLEVCPERSKETEPDRDDGAENRFVVESMGFQPYRPRAIRPYHRLAEAYRLLEEALTQASTGQIITVACQAQDAILYMLEAEGYPNGEVPVLTWDKAQPGDLTGSPETGLFRVIARKLRPKWRAKRLLAHIPKAQIWIDSPTTWAVLVPVSKGELPSDAGST
jgi:hypothetical protein